MRTRKEMKVLSEGFYRARLAGATYSQIAAAYRVSYYTVRDVLRNRHPEMIAPEKGPFVPPRAPTAPEADGEHEGVRAPGFVRIGAFAIMM